MAIRMMKELQIVLRSINVHRVTHVTFSVRDRDLYEDPLMMIMMVKSQFVDIWIEQNLVDGFNCGIGSFACLQTINRLKMKEEMTTSNWEKDLPQVVIFLYLSNHADIVANLNSIYSVLDIRRLMCFGCGLLFA